MLQVTTCVGNLDLETQVELSMHLILSQADSLQKVWVPQPEDVAGTEHSDHRSRVTDSRLPGSPKVDGPRRESDEQLVVT